MFRLIHKVAAIVVVVCDTCNLLCNFLLINPFLEKMTPKSKLHKQQQQYPNGIHSEVHCQTV